MARSYPVNHWYAIATSAELTEKPLARTICNTPIVMFRDKAGAVAVLEDICPHRKAPLSSGFVVDGAIECGYHGAQFDAHGRCIHIPSQDVIPPRGMTVTRFPALERHDMIFAWIGDDKRATPDGIPDIWSANTYADWTAVHGYHHVKANYLLVLDNLADLTHLAFVHRSTIGASGRTGWFNNPLRVTIEGDRVHSSRTMRDISPSGFMLMTSRFAPTDKIDRFQTSDFFAPAFFTVVLGGEHAGTHEEMQRPHHIVLNSVTPETEETSHYFWSVCRTVALDDQHITDEMYRLTRLAFDEDADMLERQQQAIRADRSGRPLMNFQGDQGGAAMRKVIARLIEAETEEQAA
ncbi:aromatic ring-hydroxylating dioxygenase subunit alpha [Methylocella sp. CPCC 101449]|uniref:aromatic ring-hydroxylating dioxygenase subunit alpha n=1 Tax=Methylocella sp. CPCC 101449 TaxID=2987531 RepID=UPI00288CD116|nr:aromatic ring-hydroxylating dioxygenase subunit alpha [Methylocella sp. CPCC 101449]MDT2020650.1 aromatic ring-hydroxylating dioxygenase subunit alpha [Methylocella sp. CPCC 101449]